MAGMTDRKITAQEALADLSRDALRMPDQLVREELVRHGLADLLSIATGLPTARIAVLVQLLVAAGWRVMSVTDIRTTRGSGVTLVGAFSPTPLPFSSPHGVTEVLIDVRESTVEIAGTKYSMALHIDGVLTIEPVEAVPC